MLPPYCTNIFVQQKALKAYSIMNIVNVQQMNTLYVST